jgi:hypothetical protein
MDSGMHPAHRLTVTAFAVAYPPEPLAGWLAQRRYLPRGVPLRKPILALDGQTVCRVGPLITVDGREMGIAHDKDHRGRPLPSWQGCRVIGHSEIFLMNPGEPSCRARHAARHCRHPGRSHWPAGHTAIRHATQHKAIDDYGDQRRIVRRVTIEGPVSVDIDGRHRTRRGAAIQVAAADNRAAAMSQRMPGHPPVSRSMRHA